MLRERSLQPSRCGALEIDPRVKSGPFPPPGASAPGGGVIERGDRTPKTETENRNRNQKSTKQPLVILFSLLSLIILYMHVNSVNDEKQGRFLAS